MTPSDHLVLDLVLGGALTLAVCMIFDFRWRYMNELSVSRDFERQRDKLRRERDEARDALAAHVDSEAETLPPRMQS